MASTTVNFNLKTAGYVNYANQTLTFKLLTAGAEAASGDQSYVTLPGIVTATSAANGDGSVTLYRNGKSGIESLYEVILPNREKAQFIIPSGSATIELATLLVDHAPSGSNVQQSSVYAEAIKRANHTGTQLLSTISDAGTIASQASNSVSISGGSISGVTLTASTVNLTDATDKRLMTDAQEAKLDTVETNADVTDTANVTSAGALMDSELTSIANVKALNQSLVSGASPVFTTTNMTDASNKRLMTDAQETRLDSVETNADVTDAANVTAAGALMDSEVDADIKTLTLPASTAITDFGKTIVGGSDAATVRSTLGVADTSAIAGFVPNSITFPTASDFLSIADDNDLDVGTSDFTLSFWARLDGDGTEPILNKFSTAGYSLKFSSGSLILTIQGTGDPLAVTLATGLNDNKWHVYVVSVDRDANAVAYVDNVAQTGVPVSDIQSSLDNTTAFRIGYDGANASSEIAFGNYVVLHKDALSASEAAQIYFSADTALTVGSPLPSLMVDLRKADKTFTDVSASPLAITTNGTVRFNEGRITSLDGVTIGATTPAAVTGTNVLATSTLGYTTGSGGTVTQGTSKSTTVVLNKATGQITLHGAALAANTPVTFTFTNSTIAANDILVFNHVSAGTIGAYNFNAIASSGSAVVTVRNITSGSLSEAAVVSFAVIKAVTS